MKIPNKFKNGLPYPDDPMDPRNDEYYAAISDLVEETPPTPRQKEKLKYFQSQLDKEIGKIK